MQRIHPLYRSVMKKTVHMRKAWKMILSFLGYLFLVLGYAGLANTSFSLGRNTEQWIYIMMAVAVAAVLCIELFSFARHCVPQRTARHILHGIEDLLILAFVLPMGLSVVLYEGTFFHHQTTPQNIIQHNDTSFNVLDMPFQSNTGQTLSGQLYYEDEEVPNSILILAHGNGIGHLGYMNVIRFFAKNGYGVFAYDATGYDGSDGLSTRGLPQGVIDLDCAIRYVKQNAITAGKPILLFGHSWGGYAVSAVLNVQPDVAAVISLAGFDHSQQIIEYQGKKMIGDAISWILPHLSLYERLKFGRYASFSAMDGFENTEARIIIVHSADDETVPIQFGYEQYQRRYRNDDRFMFVRYENRGHEGLFTDQDARMYLELLNQ